MKCAGRACRRRTIGSRWAAVDSLLVLKRWLKLGRAQPPWRQRPSIADASAGACSPERGTSPRKSSEQARSAYCRLRRTDREIAVSWDPLIGCGVRPDGPVRQVAGAPGHAPQLSRAGALHCPGNDFNPPSRLGSSTGNRWPGQVQGLPGDRMCGHARTASATRRDLGSSVMLPRNSRQPAHLS